MLGPGAFTVPARVKVANAAIEIRENAISCIVLNKDEAVMFDLLPSCVVRRPSSYIPGAALLTIQIVPLLHGTSSTSVRRKDEFVEGAATELASERGWSVLSV